jgi:N-acetylmuramoyl-L-alanine amidase
MKKKFFFPALCLILLFSLYGHALAANATENTEGEIQTADEAEMSSNLLEGETTEESAPPESQAPAENIEIEEPAATEEPAETEEPAVSEEPAISGPDILVNGLSIRASAPSFIYRQPTYISIRGVVEALYPDASVTWTDHEVLVQAEGLTMTACPGDTYLVANGRYLYIPDGIVLDLGVTMAPVRVLAKALGADVSWDASTGKTLITAGSGPIEDGDTYYRSDAVYWLSRIINAESGSQPLEGRVAEGTVILNRVDSPLFPDTIYDGIFECRSGCYQFSPVRSGSVYRDPSSGSVIAAKLCLDGAREAGNSLFFNATGQTCWASRNRTLVTIIGNHSFFD